MRIHKIAAIDQSDITSDKAFLSWFNGSKVTDQEGKPLSVFHGTNQEFKAFMDKFKNQNSKNQSSKLGFFFTEDINEAIDYSNYAAKRMIPQQDTFEKKEQDFLKAISKAERSKNWELAEKLTIEMESFSLGAINAEPSGQRVISVYLKAVNPLVVKGSNPNITECLLEAKNKGHDSVKFEGILDNPFMLSQIKNTTNQWVVFGADQIWIQNHNAIAI